MQEILEAIGAVLVWTFENVLEPLGDTPNTIAIFVGLFGIIYWLRIQKKLSAKALREGTLE